MISDMESQQERRKRLDHERYMRNRDERIAKQHECYIANRDDILAKVRERRRIEMLAKPAKIKFQFDAERKRAYYREWYRKNKEKRNETTANHQTQATDARHAQTFI